MPLLYGGGIDIPMEGKMRPFFSYYGSKWSGAKHYGPPRHDTVIEPFAGSACYSTRWDCTRVKLYDINPDICELWEWLIGCNIHDVESIPDTFYDYSEVDSLDRGPNLLVRFWISKGRSEPSMTLSPWYEKFKDSSDCKVWGNSVKRRIVNQKPLIDGWTIENKSWDKIEIEEAHWHIDPPYNNTAGSRYPFSNIDYIELGEWCKNLPGHVDVCENLGADWLPFEDCYEVVSTRGRRDGSKSKEVLWRKK